MKYYANPCGSRVIAAMGRTPNLGMIDTPYQGKRPSVAAAHALGVEWCADNGAFSDRFEETGWWRWLTHPEQTDRQTTCRFAVAPDVVADAEATARRAGPWLPRIRDAGYPVAYVAQDGQEDHPVPWDRIDALFVGGSTPWKLGRTAAVLVAEANARGKWTHLGRVNSARRFEYARAIGCDSVDGTFLTFGPDRRIPELLGWLRGVDQAPLFAHDPAGSS